MTNATASTTQSVTELLTQIESGAGIDAALFAADAELDAVVPNWRMSIRTGTAVADQLAGWFADPGHFEELTRVPLPDGELVELTLTWIEDGTIHAARQSHHLTVDPVTGRIVSDRLWCGGRWPAPLLAEMAEA